MNTHAGLLAEFLRLRVDESGKTLAVLSKEVVYSTSQISTYLSGRIPPRVFVVRLIAATVPPLLRERREVEALGLLRDAEHPPRNPAKPTAPAQASAIALAQVQAEQIQVYERLTRALEQEGELRQAAENSTRVVATAAGAFLTIGPAAVLLRAWRRRHHAGA
ncbi:helix-turn-helix domain-containing protein [Streptomyces sp. NPDC020422]|uniref:helix-turn-helix domain-containing protein n=1 Tax=Streptomyces sp. NPDC020422 TaxID=3365074 RepID=UPI00379494A5